MLRSLTCRGLSRWKSVRIGRNHRILERQISFRPGFGPQVRIGLFLSLPPQRLPLVRLGLCIRHPSGVPLSLRVALVRPASRLGARLSRGQPISRDRRRMAIISLGLRLAGWGSGSPMGCPRL